MLIQCVCIDILCRKNWCHWFGVFFLFVSFVIFVSIFISIVDSSDTFCTGIITCCILIIVNGTQTDSEKYLPRHVTVVAGLSLFSN